MDNKNLTHKENYYLMYPEYNFAIVKLQSESLNFDDLERLNTEYKNDTSYSNIRSLLIDIDKKCKISFRLKELNKLAGLYNTEPQKNNHKVIVWLVSQPTITALTHLFIRKTRDNSKYCSTLKKAYNLLGLKIDYSKFLELTNKMAP